MTLLFMIIGIVGLLNFEKFFELYCNFMDKRNTLNIKYPKDKFAKVVLKITLGITFLMGLIGFVLNLLIILKILSV